VSFPAAKLKQTLDATNRWRDSHNPLRALTMPRAVALMEQAQRGIHADLQWLYGADTGIEATDPDLMVIIERTIAFLSDCAWRVATIDPKTDGYDAPLAEDQAAVLKATYNGIDNLEEAVQHLCMARFRGFAHVAPWLHATDPSRISHLEVLPQWNMVRNGPRGAWAWNPSAQAIGWDQLPAANRLEPRDYIVIDNPRPINRIGLIKYVRATVAEKDWDAYVEIYGIPGVFIIMPQQVPNGQENDYAAKAAEAAEAGSGALPAGSDVKVMAEARGMQPFQARLEWLQKQLVLAGTGGLLTMLSEAGSGTLAGSVHQQAFAAIGRRQARLISQAMQRQLDARLLAARFPGRQVQAYFELREKQETNVAEAVKNIVSLAQAGYLAPVDQVAEATGYDVQYAPPPAAQPPASTPMAIARARAATSADPAATLRESAASALLEARAADSRPLAERLSHVLAAPDHATLLARASALRGELPALATSMLAQPAAADALEGAMVSAFFQQLTTTKGKA